MGLPTALQPSLDSYVCRCGQIKLERVKRRATDEPFDFQEPMHEQLTFVTSRISVQLVYEVRVLQCDTLSSLCEWLTEPFEKPSSHAEAGAQDEMSTEVSGRWQYVLGGCNSPDEAEAEIKLAISQWPGLSCASGLTGLALDDGVWQADTKINSSPPIRARRGSIGPLSRRRRNSVRGRRRSLEAHNPLSGDILKVRRELETGQNNTTSPLDSLGVGLAQASELCTSGSTISSGSELCTSGSTISSHSEEHVWTGAQQQPQGFQTKRYRQTFFVPHQLML